jgi:hypothetical protein
MQKGEYFPFGKYSPSLFCACFLQFIAAIVHFARFFGILPQI